MNILPPPELIKPDADCPACASYLISINGVEGCPNPTCPMFAADLFRERERPRADNTRLTKELVERVELIESAYSTAIMHVVDRLVRARIDEIEGRRVTPDEFAEHGEQQHECHPLPDGRRLYTGIVTYTWKKQPILELRPGGIDPAGRGWRNVQIGMFAAVPVLDKTVEPESPPMPDMSGVMGAISEATGEQVRNGNGA